MQRRTGRKGEPPRRSSSRRRRTRWTARRSISPSPSSLSSLDEHETEVASDKTFRSSVIGSTKYWIYPRFAAFICREVSKLKIWPREFTSKLTNKKMQEWIFSTWMQAMSQVVLTPALIWVVDQNDIKGLSIHFKAGKTQDDIFCCNRNNNTMVVAMLKWNWNLNFHFQLRPRALSPHVLGSPIQADWQP